MPDLIEVTPERDVDVEQLAHPMIDALVPHERHEVQLLVVFLDHHDVSVA